MCSGTDFVSLTPPDYFAVGFHLHHHATSCTLRAVFGAFWCSVLHLVPIEDTKKEHQVNDALSIFVEVSIIKWNCCID